MLDRHWSFIADFHGESFLNRGVPKTVQERVKSG
jgi:hypothetical protein